MKRVPTGVSLVFAAALLVPAGRAFAGRPTFHHHRFDSEGQDPDRPMSRSAKPAKSSAGELTLRSRALLAKDGNTQLEISTAPFDVGATPLGNISHVEVRSVGPEGRDLDDKDSKLRFRKEYEHLKDGGYFTRTYPGLPHGLNLRIEAKAKGSTHRDEVEAKLLDAVQYRPDIYVKSVDAPAQAKLGTSVIVSATLGEGMGDLGAIADCGLWVNGTQVDLAQNVVVDASGTGACMLQTSFPKAGTYTVEVRAQNVRPGDYDSSNNSMSRQITVANPMFASYTVSVNDTTATVTSKTDTYLNAAAVSANTPDKSTAVTSSTPSQVRNFEGDIQAAIDMANLKQLSFTDMSGGNTLSTFEMPGSSIAFTPSTDLVPPWTSHDSFFDSDSGFRFVAIDRYFDANHNVGATHVSVTFKGTDVITVVSSNICNNPALACSPGDTIGTSGSPQGYVVPVGNDYSANVVLDDGNQYSANSPAATLTPFSTPVTTVRNVCSAPNARGGKVCQSITTSSSGKAGSVSVTNVSASN